MIKDDIYKLNNINNNSNNNTISSNNNNTINNTISNNNNNNNDSNLVINREPKRRRLNSSYCNLIDNIEQQPLNNIEVINDLDHYINIKFSKEELQKYHINPLLFWKTNQYNFPKLAIIAKAIFTIQSSSTSSEQVFSTCGDLIGDTRVNLDPENVSSMLFLHSVKDFIN